MFFNNPNFYNQDYQIILLTILLLPHILLLIILIFCGLKNILKLFWYYDFHLKIKQGIHHLRNTLYEYKIKIYKIRVK